MGHRDRIRDIVGEAADRAAGGVADATGKEQVGFEPSVCEGCPQRGDGPLKRCGLCGCPTITNGTLHLSGMVPGDCPRLYEHERRS